MINYSVERLVTQGWFLGLEQDEKMYRKIRRYLSFDSYFAKFPSTQDILGNYVEMLSLSSSHLFDFVDLDPISKIKLATSSQSRIT